ncbi:MAG: cell envelope biogenesis protein OmpA [Bacteroidia bacterium]|nr:cell envelope biogenesis protein OmpA [Bacteroidia bacterium]MBT8311112.1 cell envelope biogenesis protein OmpA [Bacteroidia bacterium]NND11031.1 cell envelope biogenesis protein OmpA [Flavobacteriaceae bacterium]
MVSLSRKFTSALSLLIFCSITLSGLSQSETSKWKFQLAFGVNFPENTGLVNPYEPKSVNFPSINLGVQHMFKGDLGAKLDFGYNRFTNTDGTPEFKTNYTRLNAQLVYDPTEKISFLPPHFGVVAHIGPGITFMKPLGSFTENKQTYVNLLGGLELHYGITQTVSIYTDLSYIYALAGDKTYDPPQEGFGAFRGNLFTVSLGVSVSLSGCQYCD